MLEAEVPDAPSAQATKSVLPQPDPREVVLATPELLRTILSHADSSTIGRAAQVVHAFCMAAVEDEVWKTVLLRSRVKLQGAAVDSVVNEAVDDWRTRYRALTHGTCGSCIGTEARTSSASADYALIVCDGCRRVVCSECRANEHCKSRCRSCRGTASCPCCEEMSPTPSADLGLEPSTCRLSGHLRTTPFRAPYRDRAPVIWCSCCMPECAQCSMRVCRAHAKPHGSAWLCVSCTEAEYADFMKVRAEAWPALYEASHHSIY